MRMQVWSLALLSGLRILHCCELWCRLAAAALIWPLAWELPYATGAALKRPGKKKKRKKNKNKKRSLIWFTFVRHWLTPVYMWKIRTRALSRKPESSNVSFINLNLYDMVWLALVISDGPPINLLFNSSAWPSISASAHLFHPRASLRIQTTHLEGPVFYFPWLDDL